MAAQSQNDDVDMQKGDTVVLKQDDRVDCAEACASPSRRVIDDRFEVIEKLGTGGMSTVFKVRHLHLEKEFALKLLHKVSKESLQRFQLEAKASSLLDHPNIVAVRDFGITDEQPYMLMDYLLGESLGSIIEKSGGLDPGRAIALFEQIASALAHSHSQGVVHRDIKPSNIMVVQRADGSEQAILVDFGIAKLMPLENVNEKEIQHLTRTGDIFGTPLYMSPEQCLGYEIDARTDIYSLSCVLYEALCATPPFEGESVYETIHKQINEAPKPFPEKLRKSSAGRKLEAMVLKGMAKLPQNRHKHMLELASELKNCEGAGGLMEEIKASLAISFGRQKASESTAIVQDLLLRVFTILALVISINLLTLPYVADSAARSERHNQYIVQKVNKILEMRFSLRKLLKGDDEGLDRSMKLLARICKSDPSEWKAYSAFKEKVDLAVRDGVAVTNEFKDIFFTQGSNPATFNKFAVQFDKVTTNWSDAASAGASLSALGQERFLNYQQLKQTVQTILLISVCLTPLAAYFLLVGVFKRIARRRKDSRKLTSVNR